MGIFEQFPYTNFHDLNLDWILHAIQSMDKKLDEFVASNVLSYADPIQWDIETQYAKNTVVVDPKTGTAYMSINPVPVGQLLTNKYYWQPIFNYDEIVNTLKKQIAAVQADQNNIIPVAANQNALVWVANKLYRLTKSLDAGSKIIENENAVLITIEEQINTVKQESEEQINTVKQESEEQINTVKQESEEQINTVKQQLDTEQETRETADTELQNKINAETSARIAAIEEEASARKAADTSLSELIANEKTARESADNAINTILTEVRNRCVNVKDFGAVGNANYYDVSSKKYYVDTAHTITPTSDVAAINDAIAYALENHIHTVYFPKGHYYLPNWSYNLDIDKLRFVGEGDSVLCSYGLTGGAFITISSALDLNDYNTAKTPLMNISLWGAYNDGNTLYGVAGLAFNTAENVVPCHCAFYNIVVKDFNIGLGAGQSYKTIFYNFTALACGIGISLSTGSAIPLYFMGGFIECCCSALSNSNTGYTQCVFENVAFEYNRQQMYTIGRTTFINCRFEGDPLSAPAGKHVFQIQSALFENCDFLFLPNYVGNVQHWIANAAGFVKSQVDTPIIANYSGYTTFMNCKIGLDPSIAIVPGFYIISGNNIGFYNSEINAKPNNLIAESSYRTFTDKLVIPE